jgi:carbon-monoxide dehydrogenase large subunit
MYRLQGPSHSNLVAGLGVSYGGRSGFGGDENQDEGWGSEESPGARSDDWSSHGGAEQWQRDSQDSRGWNPDEKSEGGTSSWSGSGDEIGGAELDFESEYARVTLDREGNVTVYTGSSPHGQGIETTFAQLASEELNVPLDRVSVVWGDSVQVPMGIGTFGSRSAVTGGSAVVDASRKLKARLVDISKGTLVDASTNRSGLPTIAEVLEKQGLAELSAESIYKVGSMSYSSGIHLCALTLDVDIGKVKIVRYVVVEDCGRVINKKVVEGQLHGGVVHAIGGALLEKLGYDDHGNLLTTTFMDYCIPTSLDSPDIEVYHETTPSTDTLNGAKGVGESGTIVGYAAVINALNDALSNVRPGAQVDLAPATPDSIFAAIEGD